MGWLCQGSGSEEGSNGSGRVLHFGIGILSRFEWVDWLVCIDVCSLLIVVKDSGIVVGVDCNARGKVMRCDISKVNRKDLKECKSRQFAERQA